MGLVNAKEVAKAINVDKFGFLGTSMGWVLMKLLNISTMNKIYDRNKHLSDLEFINALLDEFEINFESASFSAIAYANDDDYGNYQLSVTLCRLIYIIAWNRTVWLWRYM